MRYLRFDDLRERQIIDNRTTLARWIERGHFPKPVRLGPNSIAWPENEIDAWEAARAAERVG